MGGQDDIDALTSGHQPQTDLIRDFVAAHGSFPHACCFCQQAVDGHKVPRDATAVTIHYRDGDPVNLAPTNLVPAHRGCLTEHEARLQARASRPNEGTGARIDRSPEPPLREPSKLFARDVSSGEFIFGPWKDPAMTVLHVLGLFFMLLFAVWPIVVYFIVGMRYPAVWDWVPPIVSVGTISLVAIALIAVY